MGVSVFPASVTSTVNANSITAASSGTLYEATIDLSTGIYTISCVSSTNATLDFFAGSTFITSATTSTGTVTVNLGTAATKFRAYTDTGSNIVITVTKTADALPTTTLSGTLDTIISSTTYTQTGTAYAVLVGGGGNGTNGIYGNAGGGSGAICAGLVTLTGSMAVVIGNGTTAGGTSAGGTSTFNGWSAGGGAYAGSGGTATGATFNIPGGNGGTGGANNATATTLVYPFVKNGTTGGGGSYGGQPGKGSGIGTGGNGGASAGANGGAASGYGAGGGSCGGGGTGPGVSGAGTPGVLYVLRF